MYHFLLAGLMNSEKLFLLVMNRYRKEKRHIDQRLQQRKNPAARGMLTKKEKSIQPPFLLTFYLLKSNKHLGSMTVQALENILWGIKKKEIFPPKGSS